MKKKTPYRFWNRDGDWECCNCHEAMGCESRGDDYPLTNDELVIGWKFCPYCGIEWVGEAPKYVRYHIPDIYQHTGFIIIGKPSINKLKELGYKEIVSNWGYLGFVGDNQTNAAKKTLGHLQYWRKKHPTWEIRAVRLSNVKEYDKRYYSEYITQLVEAS